MAKGIIVGILRVALGLDSAEFQDGLADAGKDGANFAAKLKKDIAGAASQVSAAASGMKAALAGIGFAGVATAVSEAAASLAALGDEAKRSGLSVKAFQEWKFVAEQNRIGIDAMTDGFKELSLRADEFVTTGSGSAAESFQRLGFSAAQLRDQLRDPSALMLEIIDRLGKLDKAAQIRIFDELLGGQGGEQFVQLLDQGADGIRKTIDRAHELGRVLDDDVIEKAKLIDKQFNEIASTVGTTLKGAIVSVAGTLSILLDSLNKVETQQTATIKSRIDQINGIFEQMKNSPWKKAYYEHQVADLTAERDRLQAELDRRPAQVTVNKPSGPSVPLPTARPDSADAAYEAFAAKQQAEQEAIAARVQSLREALMTEEEAEVASYTTRIENLKTWLENRNITQAEYDVLMQRAQQEHTDKMAQIAQEGIEREMKQREQLVNYTSDILGSLATLSESFGKKGFIAAKAFGIAQAVINTAEGITKALAQGGMLGFAGAAAVAAAGAAQIATIARTNPGSSSRPSVNGGASPDTGSSSGGGDGGAAPPQQAAFLQIVGEGTFSKQQVIDLIGQINELRPDGYKIVVGT